MFYFNIDLMTFQMSVSGMCVCFLCVCVRMHACMHACVTVCMCVCVCICLVCSLFNTLGIKCLNFLNQQSACKWRKRFITTNANNKININISRKSSAKQIKTATVLGS